MSNQRPEPPERQAEALLRIYAERYGEVSCPPVPVQDLAQRLLRLECLSGEPDPIRFEAIGTLKEGERLIITDRRFPPTISRFTIAHEIGHRVLHHGRTQTRSAECSNEPGGCSADVTRRSREEIEADRFAAALLMPRSLLQPEIQKYRVVDAAAIRELAKKFFVSPIAMLIRVKSLARCFPWNGSPIDLDSVSELEWQGKPAGTEVAELARTLQSLSWSGSLLLRSDSAFPSRRPSFTRHKIVIEIDGIPNSGKDIQIDLLAKDLRRIGFRVARIEEGFKACSMAGPLALVGQHHYLRFQWALAYTTQKLIEYGLDRGHDIVILNRGPFDFLALLHYYRSKGHINKEEEDALAAYILTVLCGCIDLVFLLETSPTVSLQREYSERRGALEHLAREFDDLDTIDDQRIVNPQSLELLSEAYDYVFSNYKQGLRLFAKVDSEREIELVAEELMKVIRPRLPEKANRSVQMHLPGLAEVE